MIITGGIALVDIPRIARLLRTVRAQRALSEPPLGVVAMFTLSCVAIRFSCCAIFRLSCQGMR